MLELLLKIIISSLTNIFFRCQKLWVLSHLSGFFDVHAVWNGNMWLIRIKQGD